MCKNLCVKTHTNFHECVKDAIIAFLVILMCKSQYPF